MKKITGLLLLLGIVGFSVVGCNTGEVTSKDREAYVNAGRAADDPAPDPSGHGGAAEGE